MENKSYKTATTHLRRVIIIVLAILICPLFYAGYLLIVQPLSDLKNVHHISSPPSFNKLMLVNNLGGVLPHSQWHNKWILLYVLPTECEQTCRAGLETLNNAYEDSIQQRKHTMDILIGTFSHNTHSELQQALRQQYPRFVHVYLDHENFSRVFANLRSKRRALFVGMFYLVSPKGKVLVAFDSDVSESVLNQQILQLITQFQVK
jgi:cytochrome oxidase Cu insertion factor (SCO1/SenC/PrrC family)